MGESDTCIRRISLKRAALERELSYDEFRLLCHDRSDPPWKGVETDVPIQPDANC
jgi:hypothetical protein